MPKRRSRSYLALFPCQTQVPACHCRIGEQEPDELTARISALGCGFNGSIVSLRPGAAYCGQADLAMPRRSSVLSAKKSHSRNDQKRRVKDAADVHVILMNCRFDPRRTKLGADVSTVIMSESGSSRFVIPLTKADSAAPGWCTFPYERQSPKWCRRLGMTTVK